MEQMVSVGDSVVVSFKNDRWEAVRGEVVAVNEYAIKVSDFDLNEVVLIPWHAIDMVVFN